MNKLITALLLIPSLSLAEGTIIDPTITPSITLNCVSPIARVDDTVLLQTEILSHNFYISTDKISWTSSGVGTACTQTYDISSLADGQYYYTSSVTDTDAQTSIKGIDGVPSEYTAMEIVRVILTPSAPTNLTITQI